MALRTSWTRATVVAAVTALALTGCGSESDDDTAAATSSGSSAEGEDFGLMDPDKLTVGMNLQFEPQMYLDGGEPAGYDVELLEMMAEDMGVELDIQNLDFNGLIPGLQSKKFDLVSVGLSDTPERRQAVDFTRGYVPYVQILGVPEGTTTEPTVEAYDAADKTITALQGSTGEKLAAETFPKAKQASFPDQNAALLEVATGRADGVVVENYLLAQFSKANPGRLVEAELPEPLALAYGSYAVQKGNDALVEHLDGWLCEKQEDGTLASTYEQVFEVDEAPEYPSGC